MGATSTTPFACARRGSTITASGERRAHEAIDNRCSRVPGLASRGSLSA
jgi:hypothetical protein